ncbi:MAG: aspartyl protease family protein [Psychroserpens sp.]|nr:aspartyl protease family protein [Psychroserpens sp.]
MMRILFRCLSFIWFLFFSIQVFAQNRPLKEGKVISSNFFESIPFEFVKNKIYVNVEIEDEIYRFLLDTGAPNMISRELYESLQPKLVETIKTSDANNLSQDLKVVQLDQIKLGGVEFEDYSALVFDFNSSPIFRCFEIDGFIGSNMLRDIILQIDAKNKNIIITDKIKQLGLKRKDSEKIKLVNDQSSPYIWIDLKGNESGREMLLIDTGMGDLYDISKTNYKLFSKRDILNEIGESEGASSVSLFGETPKFQQTRLHLPKMIINNFEIDNVITHTTNDDNSRIGAELLNYGVMTIDFRNKRFYFNAYSDSINVDGDFGITQTLKDNQLVVGYVWDKKLKDKLSYGDVIVELNGKAIDPLNICDYVVKESLLDGEKIVSLKVKNQQGNIIEIELNKRKFNALSNANSTN